MNYPDVYKKVCRLAADHLCSMEVYDQFDSEDEERIDRAIAEIQRQLSQKAEKRTRSNSVPKLDEVEAEFARLLDEKMTAEFGFDWPLLKKEITKKRLTEVFAELSDPDSGEAI